jgi:hypothetical protein
LLQNETQVKHVFCYLHGTSNYDLHLGDVPCVAGQIVAYANASHNSTPDSSSFAGSLIQYYGTIGWRTQKQTDNSPLLSTTEAEYHACSAAGQDIRWLEQLLSEIHPPINLPSPSAHLYSNNQGAIALLKNPQYSHRTCHINVKFHWLCHHLEDAKNFTVEYIKTDLNRADFLTKPLAPVKTHQALEDISLLIA